MKHCPTCTCCESDPLADELLRIRAWCREVGVVPVMGSCLRQNDAARYLGRATKTLQNWGGCLPSRKLRGRVYVSIEDLAQFIVNGGED